jgi:hypothetical protein
VAKRSPRPPKRAAAGGGSSGRRASGNAWRAVAAVALLAVAVAVVLLLARREPPAVPAAPTRTAAEIVRELAVRHGCTPADVVEEEPWAPSGVYTFTVHARPSFAADRFALELQAAAHNGGGRLDPRPVTEGGGYALKRLDGMLAGSEVRVVVLGAAPHATRPPRPPQQARRTPAPAPARGGPHRLAVVLDDAGYDLGAVEALADLPREVAVAVLPNASQARESVRELERQGREVLLHLPMEPRPGNGPGAGEGAIEVGLPPAEIAARVEAALAVVAGARGVNNHMGSRATTDAPTVRAVMAALRGRGLYFLDSRTTGGSLAEGAARAAGIPALGRDVFLDVVDEADAVRQALREAFARAAATGEAVAIGHVHPVTVSVLAAELADLPDGIRLVRPSALAR